VRRLARSTDTSVSNASSRMGTVSSAARIPLPSATNVAANALKIVAHSSNPYLLCMSPDPSARSGGLVRYRSVVLNMR